MIKIGDVVRVTDNDFTYPTYDKMANMMGLYNYSRGEYPCVGKLYTVICISIHSIHNSDIVYAIKDGDERMFLIGREGIENVKDVTPNIGDVVSVKDNYVSYNGRILADSLGVDEYEYIFAGVPSREEKYLVVNRSFSPYDDDGVIVTIKDSEGKHFFVTEDSVNIQK